MIVNVIEVFIDFDESDQNSDFFQYSVMEAI